MSSARSSADTEGVEAVAQVADEQTPLQKEREKQRFRNVEFTMEALNHYQSIQTVAAPPPKPSEPVNFRQRPSYNNSGRRLRMKLTERTSYFGKKIALCYQIL